MVSAKFKDLIDNQKDLQTIFKLLDHNARLVGGCVRDFILYDKLVYDIDIATPLLPDEMIKRLSRQFNVIPTGLQHGTVTIVGNHKYEITTLRKDQETDGRHAIVSFDATWKDDSDRRDFTINALYADSDGNIYDYHNGIRDLENNFVRFIHDPIQRIEEDYLRIMRFFRFAMRFGKYDESSLRACVKLAENLKHISRERITSEWLNLVHGKYFWDMQQEMMPVLAIIGLKSDIQPVDGLSVLGITSLFWQPSSMLLFSNAQKKYVKNLLDLSFKTQADAIIYAREFGNEFVQDKMILCNEYFEIPELGEFPINGFVLQELGLKGPEIGNMHKQLYRIWVEKLGKMSLHELITCAKVLIHR